MQPTFFLFSISIHICCFGTYPGSSLCITASAAYILQDFHRCTNTEAHPSPCYPCVLPGTDLTEGAVSIEAHFLSQIVQSSHYPKNWYHTTSWSWAYRFKILVFPPNFLYQLSIILTHIVELTHLSFLNIWEVFLYFSGLETGFSTHLFTFPNVWYQKHNQWPAKQIFIDSVKAQRLIYQVKVEIKASFGPWFCLSYLSVPGLLWSVNLTFNYNISLMFYPWIIVVQA